MIAPTAPGVDPCVRISRVAETSSERRKSVATKQRRRKRRELERILDRHRQQEHERGTEDVDPEQTDRAATAAAVRSGSRRSPRARRQTRRRRVCASSSRDSLAANERRYDLGDGDVVLVRNRLARSRVAIQRAREQRFSTTGMPWFAAIARTRARRRRARARAPRARRLAAAAYASATATCVGLTTTNAASLTRHDAAAQQRAMQRAPASASHDASPSSSFSSRLRSSKLMRSRRSHATRAAPYSATEKIRPTPPAIASASPARDRAASCGLQSSEVGRARKANTQPVQDWQRGHASAAHENARVARSECPIVSRETIRRSPSAGLRRSTLGATGTNDEAAILERGSRPCSASGCAESARAPASTTPATPTGGASSMAARGATRALPRTPSCGAIATTASPQAPNEQVAASSLDRATLPSRLRLAIRRGVASNGFSAASFTAMEPGFRARRQRARARAASGTTIAVATSAAANASGKASVKLPKRGTDSRRARRARPERRRPTATAGAATCSATTTNVCAKRACRTRPPRGVDTDAPAEYRVKALGECRASIGR